MKFSMNTASKNNRLGCAYDSPFQYEVKKCSPENRPALLEAIRAELVKVNAKLASLSLEMKNKCFQRGTRTGAAWGARYNRAANKQDQLERAEKELAQIAPPQSAPSGS